MGAVDSPSLSEALLGLRRRYGMDVVHRGQDVEPVWPTGIPAIDCQLTAGGLTQGRISVLAAGSRGATGRLTLLQSLVAIASRSMDTIYVDCAGTLDPGFLADLGANLESCLVVTPGAGKWGAALSMARALAGAGVPWLGVALDEKQLSQGKSAHFSGWEHALSALAEAVWRSRSVCVVAAPPRLPAALAHASSLTLECCQLGWQQAHGDVTGIRVRLSVVKSRLGAPGAEATVLLRYPRPYAAAGVVNAPALVDAPALVTLPSPLERPPADEPAWKRSLAG
ncbi:MAG TPA: hypothetical protein VE219_05605 [Candidatus Sulfotelmatobacter sp.]|nr:hypothetical protein [Candidatus Sulfotelmatobacter sp.]